MGQLRYLLIPLVIIAFNVTFMFIMQAVLHGAGHTYAPYVALFIATAILGVGAYLARRSPPIETVPQERIEHHS
jgi:hypothetical protein